VRAVPLIVPLMGHLSYHCPPGAKKADSHEVKEAWVSDGGLGAVRHVQGVDALEVGEGGVSDGELCEARHVQGVDALEVGKGSVSDGGLAAPRHV
jgi:hypothetical protein